MSDRAPQVYDLSAARPDGWFDEVLKQSKDFDAACKIIGRNTLGLALIAGARILSLTANPHSQNLPPSSSHWVKIRPYGRFRSPSFAKPSPAPC